MTSEAVCIAVNAANEVFPEHCSVEERNGSWQDLEQYWGDEKQRLKDCDGQEIKNVSNNLEEQLLFDDCINQPSPKSTEEAFSHISKLIRINGVEIKDIPTAYMIGGFQSHELIVIGTYVDKKIMPGFRYKVRKNLTQEHLFDGKALPLETVGQGYGKRLTFKGHKLNDNGNFFWSDSRVHGYAFTYQAIESDAVFTIHDMTTGRQIGRLLVNVPALTPDQELTTMVGRGGKVQKQVKVHFSCDVIFKNSSGQQTVFVEDVEVKGEALVVRDSTSSIARVERIVLDDFVVDGCQLIPE